MKKLKQGIIAILAIIAAETGFSQTNLNFNNIVSDVEGAIHLSWNSNSNEVYEIDYADSLIDTNSGTTTWRSLYTDYSSHGTNTFVTDVGNYDLAPVVVHPKLSTARFYRIKLVETNTIATNPIVSITSPTNGASLSGNVIISVSSSTEDIMTGVKLYIDGEEQWPSDDGTNFIINTCEWPNGPHKMFATAKSQSALEGTANGGVVTYGHSVSPYLDVIFDNLIYSFNLSQPFFEPDLGQTQQVTAIFTANVNWMLEIQDVNSNDVFSITGSGNSMLYNWDGTGTGGINIPNGAYSYLLTVETNGSPLVVSPGGGSDTNAPPSPVFAESSHFNTGSLENTGIVLLPPLPPGLSYGLDENGNKITNSMVTFPALDAGKRSSLKIGRFGDGFASAAYSGNSQSTQGPTRKPNVGVKGEVGTFGILYKTYGGTGFTAPHPLTGWPYPLATRVALDGQPATALTVDYRVSGFKELANGFSSEMKKGGWKSAFVKSDDQWTSTDIKKSSLGGNSIFNTANFGLLMTHGSYATTAEKDNVKYSYLWLLTLSNNVSEYVHLSDMDFGSSGTNGLRWMTILACNVLRPENYNSMNGSGLIPVNENLHLLLSSSTTAYSASAIGQTYGQQLTVGGGVNTIISSWNYAGGTAYFYSHKNITSVVKFAVTGWPSCFDDSLGTYNDPDTSAGLQFQEATVYTP